MEPADLNIIQDEIERLLNRFSEVTGIDNMCFFCNHYQSGETHVFSNTRGNYLANRAQLQDYLNPPSIEWVESSTEEDA